MEDTVSSDRALSPSSFEGLRGDQQAWYWVTLWKQQEAGPGDSQQVLQRTANLEHLFSSHIPAAVWICAQGQRLGQETLQDCPDDWRSRAMDLQPRIMAESMSWKWKVEGKTKTTPGAWVWRMVGATPLFLAGIPHLQCNFPADLGPVKDS